ncbi:hypothetical protein FACS1894130_02170 [Spirochaetia bacterium]|nr:hypothetical protein FACS1894130_02170 [Spirochaetia bacterium]
MYHGRQDKGWYTQVDCGIGGKDSLLKLTNYEKANKLEATIIGETGVFQSPQQREGPDSVVHDRGGGSHRQADPGHVNR